MCGHQSLSTFEAGDRLYLDGWKVGIIQWDRSGATCNVFYHTCQLYHGCGAGGGNENFSVMRTHNMRILVLT